MSYRGGEVVRQVQQQCRILFEWPYDLERDTNATIKHKKSYSFVIIITVDSIIDIRKKLYENKTNKRMKCSIRHKFFFSMCNQLLH